MLIIPYLDMPKKCEECPCYYDGWCSALCLINKCDNSLPVESAYGNKIYPGCPIIWKDDAKEKAASE